MTDDIARKRALEQELKRIDSEIRAHEADRTLRLGVFGRRGSAKSSWLAMLYEFRLSPKDGVDIRFSNDETRLYLQGLNEPIFEKGSAAATPTREAKIIKFKLCLSKDNHKETWDVETWDFTGAFVGNVSEPTIKELAEPCKQFLATADVVICFYYWKDFGVEILDCLETVFESSNYRFILALTRLDEIGAIPKPNGNWDEFLEAVELTPQQTHTLTDVVHRMRGLIARNSKLYVIPVCPLGADMSDPKNLPPGRFFPLTRDDLNPMNIYRPLKYAVKLKEQRKHDLQKRRLRVVEEREQLDEEIARVNDVREKARKAELDQSLQELEARLRPIENAVADTGTKGRGAGLFAMPENEWLIELAIIEKKAKEHGEHNIVRTCQQLTSNIQRRGAYRRLVAISLIVAAVASIITSVVVVAYVIKAFGFSP